MICENCGSAVNEGDKICSSCGMQVSNTQASNESFVPMKTTGLLVWIIIELFISPIFSIISLILYFISLQPAINSGNLELAKQKKKTIVILLIVGLVISILLTLFMVFTILSYSNDASNTVSSAVSGIVSSQQAIQIR